MLPGQKYPLLFPAFLFASILSVFRVLGKRRDVGLEEIRKKSKKRDLDRGLFFLVGNNILCFGKRYKLSCFNNFPRSRLKIPAYRPAGAFSSALRDQVQSIVVG
jgi:hypothetical protein